MTPPTFSKPKQKPCPSEVQNRRDYRTTFTTRRAKTEPITRKQAGWDMAESIRSDWDESKEDQAAFKAWLIANNRKK